MVSFSTYDRATAEKYSRYATSSAAIVSPTRDRSHVGQARYAINARTPPAAVLIPRAKMTSFGETPLIVSSSTTSALIITANTP